MYAFFQKHKDVFGKRRTCLVKNKKLTYIASLARGSYLSDEYVPSSH